MPYTPGDDLTDHTRRGRALYAAARGDATARAALREYDNSIRALDKATFGGDTNDTPVPNGTPVVGADGKTNSGRTKRGSIAGREHYRRQHPRPATTGDDAA